MLREEIRLLWAILIDACIFLIATTIFFIYEKPWRKCETENGQLVESNKSGNESSISDTSYRSVVVPQYLDFLKSCGYILLGMSAISLTTLLPIYVATGDCRESLLKCTSLQNVGRYRWKVWLVLITVLSSCFWIMNSIWFRYGKNIALNLKQIVGPEIYVIMISGLPEKEINPDSLNTKLDEIYPGKIVGVSVALKIRMNDIYESSYLEALKQYKSGIFSLTMRLKGTGIAFVGVRNTEDVWNILKTTPKINYQGYSIRLTRAPNPQTILWNNIHISSNMRMLRGMALNLFLLTVAVPLVSLLPTFLMWAIQLLMQDPVEEDRIKPSRSTDNQVFSYLMPYIPIIALIFVNAVVIPGMVKIIGHWTGFWTKTGRAAYQFYANIAFLLINTLLIPLTSGTLLSLADVWFALQKDMHVVTWLRKAGTVISINSMGFAIKYLIDSTVVLALTDMLFLNHYIWRLTGSGSTALVFDFDQAYASSITIFTLVVVFSPFFPLLILFGLIYFSIKYAVNQYNFDCRKLWIKEQNDLPLANSALGTNLLALALLFFVVSAYFFAFHHHWLGLAMFLFSLLFTMASIRMLTETYGLHRLCPKSSRECPYDAETLLDHFTNPLQKSIRG